MHQALYRKWRPRDFDDVCGQDHVTSILKNEIETGRINHAYLFCGSRGTGKTSCAKILAKAVNCLDYKNGHVCGKCVACTSADNATATDIIEMDAASNNGVSNIRDIREEVNYLPNELKYRVYIVDEVHMLSTSAFNALLKTLEEPPSHVIFILATTELHKLPSTIVSRCQRFDFRRISSSVIADRLEYIAKNEGFELEREAAYSLAAAASGGMRDAISLLELCANAAEDKKVTDETVSKLVGVGDSDAASKTVRAIKEKDYGALFEITTKIYMSSRDMSVYWQQLTAFYRDMLVAKTLPQAREYLDLSDSRYESLKVLADRFDTQEIVYHTKILDDAYISMQRSSANKRLVAECALIRMSDEKLSPSTEALAARVAKLERAIDGAGSGMPAVQAEQREEPAEKKDIKKPKYEKAPEPPVIEIKPPVLNEVKKEKSAEKAVEKAPVFQSGQNTRKLRPLSYFSEVITSFGLMYPPESAFLEGATAYLQDNGCIRIRVESELALMMLTSGEVFGALLKIFNSYENGRLDKNTLLIETVSAANKNSYIDEIIEE